MIIIVSLKTDDGKGSAVLACTGIKKDPLMARTHLILEGVRGLSWPWAGIFVKTQSWSVAKTSINWWMAGPVTDTQELADSLKGQLPHPPGTTPAAPMANNPEDVSAMLQELRKREPSAQAPEDPPPSQ